MCILRPLLELCKCSEAQICLFCQIFTIIAIAVLSGIIGYLIGKKKGKSPPKVKEQ
jgi:hypothetical protein